MKRALQILLGWPSTLILAFLVTVLNFAPGPLGRFEGRLFPVVRDVQLKVVGPVNAAYTRISGTFEKARDCEFQKIEFRLGKPGASVLLDLEFEEGSKVRPEGVHQWGPWVLHATPAQIENNVFALVYHDCHGLFPTITRFYP
tara:strand:- start:905 stop:1333 length:429 start_codon:yes stop_codon:yes gene_type:complete